ncbi:MAG: AAA family ATPase [Ardenticatenales bacterium]|nr:AAA family ATPase [Ardenticatenales bacterium]
MALSLAERLEQARRQQFVGRTHERELIREALTSANCPYAVLYICGPGGVGKTSLLREATHLAGRTGATILSLDGRNLEPSPASFLGTLQQLLTVSSGEDVFTALAAKDTRVLLSIDTAELLTPLDGWLQDNFLPLLPANVVVIMAGRHPPSLHWRTDPGWQQLMRIIPLQNLSQEESRALLMRRQVPAREHLSILQFTHGHPLALSLVADVLLQQPEARFLPEDVPNIIKVLLEQFLQEAPTANHRAALEACSQVRLMNEPLLGAMLQLADPHPVFDWLRGLSFMDVERRGLFPHDLAREALAVDLRWRNPDWQAELHARARGHYMARFRESNQREQRQVLSDYIFLHRDNPVIRPFFEWQSTGTVFTDQFQETDQVAVLRIIRAHEGPQAAAIAAHWIGRQPQGVIVMRRADGSVGGVLFMVALEKTDAEDRAVDPGTAAAWTYLQQHAPLRHGETATLFRFWMARDEYQNVSPVQSRIFLNMVQHYLTVPGLAYTMIPCAQPAFWAEIFHYVDIHPVTRANFTVDDHTFGVYGHDWRATPPLMWLSMMAERELSPGVPAGSAPAPAATPAGERALLVLSQEDFAVAVRHALRDFTSPALQENPLLRCRLIIEGKPDEESPAARARALQDLLRKTAAALQASPREAKSYRALYHTYFQPTPTQERAAELLDLPFSTYRHHLRKGVNHLVNQLWTLELGGGASADGA